jgi:hypothetical protein
MKLNINPTRLKLTISNTSITRRNRESNMNLGAKTRQTIKCLLAVNTKIVVSVELSAKNNINVRNGLIKGSNTVTCCFVLFRVNLATRIGRARVNKIEEENVSKATKAPDPIMFISSKPTKPAPQCKRLNS